MLCCGYNAVEVSHILRGIDRRSGKRRGIIIVKRVYAVYVSKGGYRKGGGVNVALTASENRNGSTLRGYRGSVGVVGEAAVLSLEEGELFIHAAYKTVCVALQQLGNVCLTFCAEIINQLI